ncbi:STAS/SEC14 domain-containing protein [Alcanivorax sp. DP30]|uniref:STAS/SEC14 domain-containing protein n=1 Tax=Alcanivorax sp. DP30 TaxID=2606217 RepID=UPI001368B5B8|nr:STAS/SEC14 domain-containing protein [Alcanivorax sp. DP30]MZR64412.1 STAS/SEC14 domain-containing protein [Alcanivorax sp. DP30]
MKVDYDENTNVVTVWPDAALSQDDLADAAAHIDPAIEKYGQLNGLIIATDSFPGWESLGALVHHFRFVRDHHRSVRRVALVTDSPIGAIAEKVADHFVAAEIHHFAFSDMAGAQSWILDSPSSP